MTEKRIALVTGGTGFVGSNLIRGLLSNGWETHTIVRAGSDLSILSGVEQKIQVHLHDGSTKRLVEIVKAVSPQVVFHLASLFLSQHTSQEIERLIHSNLLFSTQLAEAMSTNGVRYLINTGTSWQHYENKEYNPVCLYAATKQAFEAILTFYTEVANLSAITLKLYDTYGPNDPRAKLFTLLRKTAHTQEPILMSPGEQLIDLVYIDDVLDAYLLAAEHLLQNKVNHHAIYAVTSGNPIKLRDLVDTYSQIIGKPLSIEWGARPYRHREVMTPWSKGEKMPGWEPKVPLSEGIARLERNTQLNNVPSHGVTN